MTKDKCGICKKEKAVLFAVGEEHIKLKRIQICSDCGREHFTLDKLITCPKCKHTWTEK